MVGPPSDEPNCILCNETSDRAVPVSSFFEAGFARFILSIAPRACAFPAFNRVLIQRTSASFKL